MSTPITTDNVKRLSEFDTAALTDGHLVPVTNAAGTLGGKTTIAALKAYLLSNVTATIGTNGEVIAQAIVELYAAIDGLNAALRNLGETSAKCIDSEDLPKVCGTPLVTEGDGAPTAAPMFVGQRYHDNTGKKVYEAFSVTNNVSDWVLLN